MENNKTIKKHKKMASGIKIKIINLRINNNCNFIGGMMMKINILEVNEVDLIGRNFNGYDIVEYINKNTNNSANQIVVGKYSKSEAVVQFF